MKTVKFNMWDQSYDAGGGGGGGGGFMAGTPGGAEGGGSKKRQRANNIVPVFVSDVAGCVGETLVVEGQETGMLVLVGQVGTTTLMLKPFKANNVLFTGSVCQPCRD